MSLDTTRVELRFSERETGDGNVVVHCELPGIVVSVHTGYAPHTACSQDAWHAARREAQLEMVNWLRKLAVIFEDDADNHAPHASPHWPVRLGQCAPGCNDPDPHEAPERCSRSPQRRDVQQEERTARVLPLTRKLKPPRH